MLRSTFLSALLIISSIATAAEPSASISIVTDSDASAPAVHGAEAIVAALGERNISVETVNTLSDAHGKTVIIASLASGDGAAALLKSQKLPPPQGRESLVVRRLTLADGRSALLLAGS